MDNLIENILINDLVLAQEIFEERLDQIVERKLYEKKRMIQAEALGGLTRQEIEDRKKAGYRKAADVLPDPRDIRIKKIPLPDMKKEKKISEATEKSTAGIRGAMLSKDPEVAARARKSYRKYRLALGMSGRKGLGGKAPKARDISVTQAATPTPTPTPKDEKPGIIKRNVNTLMGREPDYKPEPSKGGRAGRAARGIIRTGAKLAGDVFMGLEEGVKPKRKIIIKKKKSMLIPKKDKYMEPQKSSVEE